MTSRNVDGRNAPASFSLARPQNLTIKLWVNSEPMTQKKAKNG